MQNVRDVKSQQAKQPPIISNGYESAFSLTDKAFDSLRHLTRLPLVAELLEQRCYFWSVGWSDISNVHRQPVKSRSMLLPNLHSFPAPYFDCPEIPRANRRFDLREIADHYHRH